VADVVATQILHNGNNWWAYSFTSASDGTGEAAVTKVDGSPAGPLAVIIGGHTFFPGFHIKVREIEYDVRGMQLQIIWDATAPQNVAVLGGFGHLKYDRFGGLAAVDANGASLAGATGIIKFTTLQQQAGSSYTVVMRGTKGIHQ
jgi:hypothetical protein